MYCKSRTLYNIQGGPIIGVPEVRFSSNLGEKAVYVTITSLTVCPAYTLDDYKSVL